MPATDAVDAMSRALDQASSAASGATTETTQKSQHESSTTSASKPGLLDRIRGKGTAPPEKPKLTQADLIEGGRSKVKVKIDPKTMAELLDKMRIKAKNAKSIQDRLGSLSSIDTYLLQTDVIQRLEAGQLSREDYIFALLDIHDELFQKALASGKIVGEGKYVPKTGILGRGKLTAFEDYTGAPIRDSTYIQEVGYSTSEYELTRLNQLRIKLNESLFGKGSHT